MSFNSFNLHPQIAAGVKALGYRAPYPARAIRLSCRKRRYGLAQTGTANSGLLLPVIKRLMKSPRGPSAPLS
jgi:ATP-dependent RNA helicase RhlE